MLDIKIGSVLLGYSLQEQTQILDCVYGGEDPKTKRIEDAGRAIVDIIMNHEEIVEGYAGFPVEKKLIDKNKIKFDKDRNIGRVISQGGESFVITGMKNDGRYQIMGKKGEKTAKEPRDLGLNLQRPGGVTEGIDIDALHNEMVESLKQARKNVGAGKCWDGYTAKGTKKKGGKVVPNCVKDHHEKDADGNVIPHDVTDPKKSLDEKKGLWDNIHAKRKRGEKPAKPGDKDYPKTLNVEKYSWRNELGLES
tara:strand:- start:176 stop:928 length:753 start_codon:yes stop_codon:yes gene_type:complete